VNQGSPKGQPTEPTARPLTLGDVSGWRLPARMELITICGPGRDEIPPSPDSVPNTPAEYF